MFRFRLETLLGYKKMCEENLQRELAEKNRKVLYEKGILKGYQDEYRKNEYGLDSIKEKDRLDVGEINSYYGYFDRLLCQSNAKIENINHASQDADKKREEVLEALKNRKIIEHLKETEYRTYVEEINRKEQKVIDEIVITRHKKKEGAR